MYTQGTTKVHWMPITTRFFLLFSNEEIYYCLDSVDSQVKWNLLLKINVPEFISLEMGDDRNESQYCRFEWDTLPFHLNGSIVLPDTKTDTGTN